MIGPRRLASWMLRPLGRKLNDAGAALTTRPPSDSPAPPGRSPAARLRPRDVWDLVRSTWRPRRATLITHLSPDGCRDVLARNADGIVPLFGSKPAYGWVGSNGARLTKRAGYFNAWQTVLSCDFAARGATPGAGTTLRLRSRAGVVARLLTGVWLAAIIFGLLVYFAALRDALPLTHRAARMLAELPFPHPLVPVALIALLAIGVAVVAALRWLSRDDHDWLVVWVGRTLGARRG